MLFSLEFLLAVKPIQCCSMEVAPCMIDLNITPGHKSHLSINIYMIIKDYIIVLDSIVGESHCFSFTIL